MNDKEVLVIDENNNEISVKQYCKRVDAKDLVLLSNTTYDNNNKIFHKYFDCYEDWPIESLREFEKWKIVNKNNLVDYTQCARCTERIYREKNPNAEITGYGFHYYYEDL